MRKIERWIERTHAVDILKQLSRKDKMYFTELKNIIGEGSSSTINIVLNELEAINLIEEKIENKFGGKRYIWLTPMGKRIAEKLIEIEKILKEK